MVDRTSSAAGESAAFASIEGAIADIRDGRMIIVLDDDDRENEGDLIMAAQGCQDTDIAFMRRHGSGVICVPLTRERLDELALPQMVARNEAHLATAFSISVDAREGISSGISAADRARTIQLLADPERGAADLVRPGHIFPLEARDGGVLVRAGHTEAALDLCRMAGTRPAAVLCEISNDDGSMQRLPELTKFAEQYGLKMITVKDLIAYRMAREQLVERVATATLPTEHGEFTIHGYRARYDATEAEHVALVIGDIANDEPVLVRVHSECLTGDVFGSYRCDCGEQVDAALEAIAREGRGVLVYLRQEGRGIGLMNKLRAYELQDGGLDTVEANERLGFKADQREYGVGVQILLDLGVTRVRLLTNNPHKLVSLYGLEVVGRQSLEIPARERNRAYLDTKRRKMGHLLTHDEPSGDPLSGTEPGRDGTRP